MPSMLAETPQVRFGEGQIEQLLAHLATLNDNTLLMPIAEVGDVTLRDDGLTFAGGRRMTSLAMRQICQHTAAGLSVILADIAGINRRHKDPAAVSPVTAIKIYNLAVQLRFFMENGLFNRQLVVDVRRSAIDGMLGPNYKYLAHSDLLDAASAAIDQLPQAAVFDSAELVGRHLTVTWRNVVPFYAIGGKLPIYGGYCVTNSEAGECSVAAAMSLMVGNAGSRCLYPIGRTAKTAHAGKHFKRRLGLVLGSLMTASERLQDQANNVRVLTKYPLHLMQANGQVNPHSRRKILRWLSRAGVKPVVAADVVKWTLMGSTNDPSKQAIRDASTRTVYDLFLCLCDRAASYSYQVRATLEQAAFMLLLKPIHIHE